MTSTSAVLKRVWEEHPHNRYRGCAPDPDMPGRAAGDPSLSLDAWHGEDRDGAEPQRDRLAREEAAKEVCLNCPVMVQCDAYASSVTEDGRLAEPSGIWGGRLALDRHRAFIARRHELAAAAPERMIRTPQKLQVLRALAAHISPEAVAAAAGVDVRTANWQRSRLVTQFNLDKPSATRRGLLAAAVERGLLEPSVVVADDGTVPAVPPPVSHPRTAPSPTAASTAASTAVRQGGNDRLSAARSTPPGSSAPAAVRPLTVRPSRSRRRVTVVPAGQLTFDDALAPVTPLFPVPSRLEAAA